MDLQIRVIARAGRSGFAGLRDGALLVRLAAAPGDRAPNHHNNAHNAQTQLKTKKHITIVSGERARSKRIRIAGIDREQALAKLV